MRSREPSWQNDRMANGRMTEWQNGRMTEWQMTEWQMAEWQMSKDSRTCTFLSCIMFHPQFVICHLPRSYAVGRFSATAGVKVRGPGNLGGDADGPRTTHAPHIDTHLCTSVNQLRNSYCHLSSCHLPFVILPSAICHSAICHLSFCHQFLTFLRACRHRQGSPADQHGDTAQRGDCPQPLQAGHGQEVKASGEDQRADQQRPAGDRGRGA